MHVLFYLGTIPTDLPDLDGAQIPTSRSQNSNIEVIAHIFSICLNILKIHLNLHVIAHRQPLSIFQHNEARI